jgi:hypothetical protein
MVEKSVPACAGIGMVTMSGIGREGRSVEAKDGNRPPSSGAAAFPAQCIV